MRPKASRTLLAAVVACALAGGLGWLGVLGAFASGSPRVASARAPRELKLACAQISSGLMRYAALRGDCDPSSERVVSIAREAPVYACVSLRYSFSHRAGRHPLGTVIPRGTVWRAPRLGYCKLLGQREIELGGTSAVHLCAALGDGLLRYVEDAGRCDERELELLVPGIKHGPHLRHRHQKGGPPGKFPSGSPPPAKPPGGVVPSTPTALAQSLNTQEGVALAMTLTGESHPVGRPLSFAIASAPAHGALSGVPPNITYTPSAGYSGSDSFTFTVSDGSLKSAPATVSITVVKAPHHDEAPVLSVPSPQTQAENAALSFSNANINAISVSDADSEGGEEQLKLAVAHGTLELTSVVSPISVIGAGSGALTLKGPITALNEQLEGLRYVPAHNYKGSDSLSVEADDLGHTGIGGPLTTNASVELTVTPVIYDTAVNDSYSTHEDSALHVVAPGVLANDTDSDTPALALEVLKAVTQPAHGTLTLNKDGSFEYTPAAGYYGPDSFTYKDTDGNSESNVATVSLDVEQVDQAPSNSLPSGQSLNENATLTFSSGSGNAVSVSDADSEGGVEQVKLSMSHGTLKLGNTSGLESVSGNGSALVTIRGAIAGLNTALNGMVYTPAHDYHGSDSLEVETDDLGHTGLGGPLTTSGSVALTVNAVTYDTAVADSYSTKEDEALEVSAPGVLSNDKDSDAPPLTLQTLEVTKQPLHGTVTLKADGSFKYTPSHLFVGSDTFSYKDTDGNTPSNEATASISVERATFDAAVNDSYSVHENTTLNEGAAQGVLSNDTDSEGLTLQAVLVSNVTHGKLTLNSDGSFAYEPEAGFSGTDSFTYKDTDGNSESNTATVSIEVEHVDQAPVNSLPLPQSLSENATLMFSSAGANQISVSDTDSEGGVEQVKLSMSHGTVKLGNTSGLASASGNGSALVTMRGTIAGLNTALSGMVYTPVHDYHGADSLEVETDDLGHTGLGGPLTTSGSVAITVSAVTYDSAVADSYTATEDQALEVAAPGVLANDTDSDSPPLSLQALEVVKQPLHGTVTLKADGSFKYTPDHLFVGTDTFTYRDTDGNTPSNEATVSISVEHATFDKAVADSYSVLEGTTLKVAAPGVLANDTDSEGLALEAMLVSGVSHGKLTLQADGSFEYEPNAGFSGTDSFTYKDSDGNSESNTATVTIEVTVPHVNVAPVLKAPAGAEVGESIGASKTSLVFSKSKTNAITVSDEDAEGGTERVTLKATHGTLAPGTESGLTVSGSGTGTLSLEGTIASLNEGLEGLAYAPASDYSGSDSIAIEADDLGHTGTGGPKTASASIEVTVAHPNPTPSDPTYSGAIGNTELSVGVSGSGPDVQLSGSVLPEAKEADGSTLHATAGTIATEHGGSVSMNEDGTFTYQPPVGYDNASDKFTYTETDSAGGKATGTATIKIDNARVWYVNDSLGSNGNGGSNSPFNVLSAVTGAGNPTVSGDEIFLYGGGVSYTGGIAPKSNQVLDGQSDGLTVEGDKLVNASGENPTVTGSGTGIALAEGDSVRGITVSGTGGTGIAASSVGSFTLDSKVRVTGTTGTALEVSGGSGTVTDEATLGASGSTHSLSISGRTGGTFTASGPISDEGAGISLSSNSGATVNLTGKLTLDTTTHSALSATGGGTLAVMGGENTVSTSTGAPLTIENTTIGAAGVKFKSISAGTSSSGPANGIVLSSTGTAGGLTVTGSASAASGGTIEDTTSAATGAGDVVLKNTGPVSLTDMKLTGKSKTPGSGVFSEDASSLTLNEDTIENHAVTGIHADWTASGSGSFSIHKNTIDGQEGSAIQVENDGAGLVTGHVTENTIGIDGIKNSGSAGGEGIDVDSEGATPGGTFTVEVSGNTIRQVEQSYGILAGLNKGAHALNLTLTNNNVLMENTTTSGDGMSVSSGSNGDTVCLNASNNTSVAKDAAFLGLGAAGLSVIQDAGTSIFQIQGYSGGTMETAEVQKLLEKQNPGLSGPGGNAIAEILGGGETNTTGFTGGTCATAP